MVCQIGRVLTGILIISLIGCASQQKRMLRDWDEATRTDSRLAYEEILKKYSGTSLASDAERRLKQIIADSIRLEERTREDSSWSQAMRTESIAALESFLSSFPSSRHAETACSTLWNLYAAAEWRSASSRDTRDAYMSVISLFPSTAYANSALVRLHQGCTDTLLERLRKERDEQLPSERRRRQEVTTKPEVLVPVFGVLWDEPGGLVYRTSSYRTVRYREDSADTLDANCFMNRLRCADPYEGVVILLDSTKVGNDTAFFPAINRGLNRFYWDRRAHRDAQSWNDSGLTPVLLPSLVPGKARNSELIVQYSRAADLEMQRGEVWWDSIPVGATDEVQRLLKLLQERSLSDTDSIAQRATECLLSIGHPFGLRPLQEAPERFSRILLGCLSKEGIGEVALKILQGYPSDLLAPHVAHTLAASPSDSRAFRLGTRLLGGCGSYASEVLLDTLKRHLDDPSETLCRCAVGCILSLDCEGWAALLEDASPQIHNQLIALLPKTSLREKAIEALRKHSSERQAQKQQQGAVLSDSTLVVGWMADSTAVDNAWDDDGVAKCKYVYRIDFMELNGVGAVIQWLKVEYTASDGSVWAGEGSRSGFDKTIQIAAGGGNSYRSWVITECKVGTEVWALYQNRWVRAETLAGGRVTVYYEGRDEHGHRFSGSSSSVLSPNSQ